MGSSHGTKLTFIQGHGRTLNFVIFCDFVTTMPSPDSINLCLLLHEQLTIPDFTRLQKKVNGEMKAFGSSN